MRFVLTCLLMALIFVLPAEAQCGGGGGGGGGSGRAEPPPPPAPPPPPPTGNGRNSGNTPKRNPGDAEPPPVPPPLPTYTPHDCPVPNPAPPPTKPASTPKDKPVAPGNLPLPPGTRPPSDKPGPTTPPEPDAPPPPEPDLPVGPTTPGGTPAPSEDPEDDEQPAPEAPRHDRPTSARAPSARGRRMRTQTASGWKHWWYFNREQVINFRSKLRRGGPVSGNSADDRAKQAAERRIAVRTSLRRSVLTSKDESLRSAALVALGRMGGDDDANLMLHVILDKKSAETTREAAALALGLLPAFTDAATRTRVRQHLNYWIGGGGDIPRRTRSFATISAGLRAQSDPLLVMCLGMRLDEPGDDRELTAALLVAGGLAGDRMLAPELLHATRKGRVGDKTRIDDIVRGHAAAALGRLGDANATRTLVAVIRSRSAGEHAKRSATLALGRLLRKGRVTREDMSSATSILRKTADRTGDTELRGFALLALSGSSQLNETKRFMKVLDSGGNGELRAYAALALGLNGRRLGSDKSKPIARMLVAELEKANVSELEASICLALGLVRAEEARDALLDRIEDRKAPYTVRFYATQAIGMLGRPSARASTVLKNIVRDGPRDLAGEAALSLGLLGQRSVAMSLVKLLEQSRSRQAQGLVTLALGHFANKSATDPLVALLDRRGARPQTREFAAVALGLMLDKRQHDVFFDLPGDMNFHGTTRATHRMLAIY